MQRRDYTSYADYERLLADFAHAFAGDTRQCIHCGEVGCDGFLTNQVARSVERPGTSDPVWLIMQVCRHCKIVTFLDLTAVEIDWFARWESLLLQQAATATT